MTPAEAIMILIWLLVIAGGAWFVQWCVENAVGKPLPQPVRFVIWGIAALLGLLVLLGAFDVGVPTVVDVD